MNGNCVNSLATTVNDPKFHFRLGAQDQEERLRNDVKCCEGLQRIILSTVGSSSFFSKPHPFVAFVISARRARRQQTKKKTATAEEERSTNVELAELPFKLMDI